MWIKIREWVINSEHIIAFNKNKIRLSNDGALDITQRESEFLEKLLNPNLVITQEN